MDKSVRNSLRNTVTFCRKLLENSISERLEGQFGIFRNGKIEDSSRLGHLSAEDQEYRGQLLIHLEHIQACNIKSSEAVEQLIREIAFTHLNRLCAYKLMEARGLIRESVSKGTKSQGFLFYLADHPEDEALLNAGDTEKAYRHFLRWMGNTLNKELGALFAEDDPANRLYPPQRVLDQVLELINTVELKDIWTEDETIGWVYQYFTPKELRDQARKESSTPRNSYELAFRNQFYTPRYVVEFLTDNTLGRTWYEMRHGETRLLESCKYMVLHPNIIWLKEGEEAQILEGELEKTQVEKLKEVVFIPFRPIKDPREIKILDPACGSGHFLLYCFDLLFQIYTEAWDDCSDLLTDFRTDLTRDEFLRRVPGMILSYNLHGIDIDLRATQIASLALWLRVQKTYQELGLKPEERPNITRTNIVCAEPMPGEAELLDEFCQDLNPPLIRQLVKAIFEKTKLAGEVGSLLKVEEELEEIIHAAKQQLNAQSQTEQLAFWPQDSFSKQLTFDLSGIATSDGEFWKTVEDRVLETLHNYAKNVGNGRGFRRKLFVDDTEHGFAFIDLLKNNYDVILMNPPFGIPTEVGIEYLKCYQTFTDNIATPFAEKYLKKSSLLGMVIDRSLLIRKNHEGFRSLFLDETEASLVGFANFGWGTLDANVEVSVVIGGSHPNKSCFFFKDIGDSKLEDCRWIPNRSFEILPNKVISGDIPHFILNIFGKLPQLSESNNAARVGHQWKSDRFLRLWWEVGKNSGPYVYNGAPYSPYYFITRNRMTLNPEDLIAINDDTTVLRNSSYHYKKGIGYGKRGEFLDAHPLPEGQTFTVEGLACFPNSETERLVVLAYLNSAPTQVLLSYYCGQHKHVGYINKLPFRESWKLLDGTQEKLVEVITKQHALLQRDETSPFYCSIYKNNSLKNMYEIFLAEIDDVDTKISEVDTLITNEVASWLSFPLNWNNHKEINDFLNRRPIPNALTIFDEDELKDKVFFIGSIFNQLIGYIFGRWDIRLGINPELVPNKFNIFDPIPESPPGSLLDRTGFFASSGRIVSEAWLQARAGTISLPEQYNDQVKSIDDRFYPSTIPDSEYPIKIVWDGILVDDPHNNQDIIKHLQNVLDILFDEHAEVIEQEVCLILDIKSLREYYRKSGPGGFWMDHVKRYSKSRRKSPIYWLLQSRNKNYGMWLYYHRLDKDILFKALTQYVEPKIRLEEERLSSIRSQRGQFGTGGKEAKDLEKEIEDQDNLLIELEDFRDKLHRAADLGLDPDLNDGVALNIAPLWELVPWSEPKKYWEELLDGKYEWSSIGKQLRAKGLVK